MKLTNCITLTIVASIAASLTAPASADVVNGTHAWRLDDEPLTRKRKRSIVGPSLHFIHTNQPPAPPGPPGEEARGPRIAIPDGGFGGAPAGDRNSRADDPIFDFGAGAADRFVPAPSGFQMPDSLIEFDRPVTAFGDVDSGLNGSATIPAPGVLGLLGGALLVGRGRRRR